MNDNLVQVVDLKKLFPLESGFFSRSKKLIHAVDGVSFDIKRGEILGLAGESGCGKTTLGRLLSSLYRPTEGKIFFEGINVLELNKRELKEFRRNVQMIFQDPYDSLNPRIDVKSSISEPLKVHNIGSPMEREEMIREILNLVKLPPTYLDKYPSELSGGESQRVSIARAMVLKPKFLIADEPVSMLDLSIRAGILKLIQEFKQKLGAAILLISHDLSVERYLSDRIAIMYLGKIIEIGTCDEITEDARHPYTKILLSSIPTLDPARIREGPPSWGEPPTPFGLDPGCAFYSRCPCKKYSCKEAKPSLTEVSPSHFVTCHLI